MDYVAEINDIKSKITVLEEREIKSTGEDKLISSCNKVSWCWRSD